MKYRILKPIMLQHFHFQPAKQLFLTFEISPQCRKKQTFSKTARTTQKIDLSFRCKRIDHIGLVHIDKSLPDNLLESLNANRVFHIICN